MSKKPLADDRRRELATEAFAKVVRAAFKGETDKAKEGLTTIETQFPEEADVVERARRFAAMTTAKDARTGKPKNASERFLGAVISLNAGDVDVAEKELEALSSDDAKNADVHYALAIVRARREKTDEAVASLKSAIALSPERRAQAALDGEFAALVGTPAFDSLTAA